MPNVSGSQPFNIFHQNINRLTFVLESVTPHAEGISKRLDEAKKNTSDPSIIDPLIEEFRRSVVARGTILTWAVPMMVTFAEAYLEDAFSLIISAAYKDTSLPNLIADEISQKWIKNTMRSGNPPHWINQLKKFGVTGYPDDLAAQMQKIWDVRHEIIHSAVQDQTVLAKLPIGQSLGNVGKFVQITDPFVVSCSQKPVTQTPTSA